MGNRLLLAAMALCVLGQPALAQKTKTAEPDEAVTAVGLLETCTALALGTPGAEAETIAAGWERYDNESESIFVESFEADLPRANDTFTMLVLDESYPSGRLGYCRIDNYETAGPFGLEAIDALPGIEGELTEDNAGLYGSWSWSEDDVDFLLLAHEAEGAFVLQLTALED
jgi:hypothetical protein